MYRMEKHEGYGGNQYAVENSEIRNRRMKKEEFMFHFIIKQRNSEFMCMPKIGVQQ